MKNPLLFVLGALMLITAAPVVRLALTHADDACLSLDDAKALGRQGKYREAIEKASMVLNQEPPEQNKRTLLFLGLMFYKAGMNQEALARYREVAARYPDSPMAYYFMGMLYEDFAVKASTPASAADFKRQAIAAWQNYVRYAEERLHEPPAHTETGISREESIKRARKHIELLQEALQ